MNGNPGEKWDHSPEAKHGRWRKPQFPWTRFSGREENAERLTLNMGRKFRPIYIFYTRGPHPPSFFVRPACSPLLSLVLSMEGTSCAARLMPAGHDCAAITRSSGMTKMSKRKIMVRKWSGGWGWNEYRRNWWAPVKNPWEVDDESQLRSRKRNRRWGCLGCVVSWLMLFFKEDLN